MRKLMTLILWLSSIHLLLNAQENYQPSSANLMARKDFQDDKFGMFIHWGLSSVLGDGEWVMQNRKILKKDYQRYIRTFNPVDYDPEKWVLAAKAAGMHYIVFITRHHDGFSNWDTKYSDWKITNTPYGKDALKMLADACHKHGMKLGLYYSTLDWYRDDYPHESGRTGQYSGRDGKGDYNSYLQFMKNQLTELLTNYGPIMSIWFDGHWDQTNPEGHDDRSSRINWKYDEIYSLIHRLQPATLIGNNHHLTPFPGEDFQMFERDLPGENTSGLSYQEASAHIPVETCETMSDSWGYRVNDTQYKSVKTLIHMLAGAAGRNANLLLNVGPLPNGALQPENIDTLTAIGHWTQQYGSSLFNTRGKIIEPQEWGVVTGNDQEVFVHILNPPHEDYIFLPGFTTPITTATNYQGEKIKFTQVPEGTFIYPEYKKGEPDWIIRLRKK
ncbi:MAG: alpha-L-fucosidase [Saprospiraceae bacterium]|nr:alpha-L-fucosidase [Saprospiraceae bacterium]